VLVIAGGLGVAAHAMTSDRQAVSARGETVLLFPPLYAGQVGWCLQTRRRALEAGGCGITRAGFPIIAESLHGTSTPQEITGVDLTASTVAAVSVGGSAPLPTRSESVLPDGLRVVVWGMPGETTHSKRYPPRITPLDARGSAVSQTVSPASAAGGFLPVELSTRNLVDPAQPPAGPCAIKTSALRGLMVKSGSVINQLNAYTGLVAEAFIVCASSEYLLENWPISASVVVDAAHPGTTPPPLPMMKPVPRHPQTVQALSAEGWVVARRLRGGWLIVSGGKNESQQLALLEHARAAVAAA
jgi:hypothetical protein